MRCGAHGRGSSAEVRAAQGIRAESDPLHLYMRPLHEHGGPLHTRAFPPHASPRRPQGPHHRRDRMIDEGMEVGTREGYERLDDLLAGLRR